MTNTTATPFVETEILLAHLQGDAERVEELVQSLLAGERALLGASLEWLADRCSNDCPECSEFAPRGDRDWITYSDRTTQTFHKACLAARRERERVG